MSPLYTPEILHLAVSLAQFGRLPAPDCTIERTARPCGSSIILDLSFNSQAIVNEIGMHISACAFGQAAAAILARGIVGRDAGQLLAARDALALWLHDAAAPMPDWPHIEMLAAARAHPARHGAILLPFAAAADVMNNYNNDDIKHYDKRNKME
jgi:NifU-like protein involved in Fe-S cluster formation